MSPNDKASYFPLVIRRILPLNWTLQCDSSPHGLNCLEPTFHGCRSCVSFGESGEPWHLCQGLIFAMEDLKIGDCKAPIATVVPNPMSFLSDSDLCIR